MLALKIILAVAFVFVLVLFFAMLIMSRKTFGRGEMEYDVIAHLNGEQDLIAKVEAGYEYLKSRTPLSLETQSYDGLRLAADYFPAEKEGKRFILCMHGYHSHASSDFSGAIKFFNDMGFNVISVNQRAHGRSEGRTLTMGIKERYDCKSWCEFIISRFGKDCEIVLDGLSMGASTVLLASDRRVNLPKNVKAIIADCGFNSPWDIVCLIAKKQYKLPVFPFLHVFRLVTLLSCGFDLRKTSCEEAVANTDIPIFFAHGKQDDFVPYYMSERMSRACSSEHVLFSSERASHGLSFIYDTDAYKKECMDFIKKFLSKQN